MKIIILEGSSASGKTRTANELLKLATNKGFQAKIIEESVTLMPILANRDCQVAIKHINSVIDQAIDSNLDMIIFDRLHLTPAAVTNSTLKKFAQIESKLKQFNSTIVFLEMKEEVIEKRIFDSMKYRDPSWEQYVRKKGSDKDIVRHYTDAQRKLQKLINETKLPIIRLDTTNQEFGKIAQVIAEKIF